MFAFLLNFPWEFWQVPFFADLPQGPHWHGVERCTQAALGDAVLAVIAYLGVAAFAGRRWVVDPRLREIIGFVAVGLAMTLVIEWVSVGALDRWAYADRMPLLPFLGVGLLPVAQWITLPPLVVWMVSRQLRGAPQV
jgi:hypothetical protein